MYTEKEAGEKWCQQDKSEHREFCCLASVCMAWLWEGHSVETCVMDNRIVDEKMSRERGCLWLTYDAKVPPPEPVGEGWVAVAEPRQKAGYMPGFLEQIWERPIANRRGYCGLVGKG